MMVDLNKLAAEIHEAAVKKGFWDVEDAEEKHLAKMISELGEVVQADRAGIMYEVEHEGAKPEGVVAELADFVMMAIDMYAANESDFDVIQTVCTDFEALRKLMADTTAYTLVTCLMYFLTVYAKGENDGALGNAIYTALAWTEVRGFDLWEIIRQKMAYNESRPALHGRLY